MKPCGKTALPRRILFREQPMTVEEKLRGLGLVLPLPSVPADVCRRARRVVNLDYPAGRTPNIGSRPQPEYADVAGRCITSEPTKKEAELSGLNILAALKVEAGSLDKVKGGRADFGLRGKCFRLRRSVPASSTTPPNSLSRSAEKAVLRRAWRSALRGVRGNLRDFASRARLKKLCGTRGRSIALAGRAAPYRRSRGNLRAKPGGVRFGKERSVPDEQIGASRRGRRICRI